MPPGAEPWSWIPPEWLGLPEPAPVDPFVPPEVATGTQVPSIFGPITSPVPSPTPPPPPPPPTVADLTMQAPRGDAPSIRTPLPPPPPPPPLPPEPYRLGAQFSPYESIAPTDIQRDELVLPEPEIEMPADEGRVPLPQWVEDLQRRGDEARTVESMAGEYERDPLKFRTDLERQATRRDEEYATAATDAAKVAADADRLYGEAARKAAAETEAIAATATAQANDGTWFDRAGTGTKIAGYLAAAVAGFLNPTGLNSVVELIKSANEGDVRRRAQALQERRAGVEGMLAGAKELRAASQADLMANYQVAINEIDTRLAKLDPLGDRARNLAATRSALAGELQAAAQAGHEQAKKDALDQAEFDLKTSQAAKARADAAVANKKAAGGTGTGDGGLAPTGIAGQGSRKGALTGEQWRSDKGVTVLPPDIDRPAGYSAKELKNWQQTHKADDSSNVFGGLKQPDGQAFVAQGSDTDISAAKKMYLGMQAVVSAIDSMDRNRSGFTSDFLASDENQTIKSQWQRARLYLGKTFELGALSEEDLKIVDGFLTSGKDPTGFRKVLSALTSARGAIIEDTNNALVLAGYKGDLRKEIPAAPKGGRTQSVDEKAFSNIVKVGDPKVVGPLAKRLKGIVLSGEEDPDIDREAALTMLRELKRRGGKFKGYAKDILSAADAPRYKASEKESDAAHAKLGGQLNPPRDPNPDADFFEATPEDFEAADLRDIAEFEKENGL